MLEQYLFRGTCIGSYIPFEKHGNTHSTHTNIHTHSLLKDEEKVLILRPNINITNTSTANNISTEGTLRCLINGEGGMSK